MSLSAAIGSATSSLRAIQLQLALSSANIANADNPHYTAKRAALSPSVTGGMGTGVDVTGIGSGVDANLLRGILGATSDDGAAQAFHRFMSSLSDSLGHITGDGGGTATASKVSTLQSRLDKLATTPESGTLKGQVVSALDDAMAALRTNAEDIQRRRADADAELAKAVDAANDALRDIHTLNDAIIRAKAASQPTADLEDLRNAALTALSREINVNSYVASDGRMTVYSGAGEILVGGEVHPLTFTAADKVSAHTAYPSDLSGVRVNGNDISGAVGSGRISALLAIRDRTLPETQKRLDATAAKLKDAINAAANAGSASPPPNALAGTVSHAATDPLSATGTLRVAITDAAGSVVGSHDLDLSSYATVGDLVGALNAIPGASAALDANGRLTVRATAADQGIALAGGNVSGKTLSAEFGLNDLIAGDDTASLAVRPELLAEPSRLPTSALQTLGPPEIGSGSTRFVSAFADALRNSGVATELADLVGDVGAAANSAKSRADAAKTGLNALTSRFSSQYCVNIDEENARIAQLQNAYAASSQILAAAKAMFNDLLAAVR